MEDYIRKTIQSAGIAGPDREKMVEHLAREVWETLVLSALQAEGDSVRNLVFKGGSALRLVYGSDRMSSDLDFDEPQEPTRDDEEELDETPGGTSGRVSARLRRAEELLSDFGFSDVRFNLVKEGEGTVRFKTSAEAKFKRESSIRFVSKVEVSRRRSAGLEAVAEQFGRPAIETTMKIIVPEGLESKRIKSEQDKLKGLFVKTYTPLAIFLMKMQAVASPSRRTARDVYDMAYIWSRLGLGSEDRKEFLSGCVRAFAESGMKQAERDMFMTMLREKGDRFLQDLDDGADLQFSSPVDKDETGLFVLGFIDEFSSFVERDATMGLSL